MTLPRDDAGHLAAGPRIAGILTLAVAYFLGARLGVRLAFPTSPGLAAIWPASGIALAALLLVGSELWPGIWLGAFVTQLVLRLAAATHPPLMILVPATVLTAGGSAAESLVGAWLVRRWLTRPSPLERVADVLRLLLLAGAAAALISPTIGVLTLLVIGLVGASAAPQVWMMWWLGDTAGIMVVAPALLAWFRPRDSRAGGGAELALFALLFGTSATLIFLNWGGVAGGHSYPYPLFLFALWVALRFGNREATLLNLLVGAFAVSGTVIGRGPFASEDPHTGLLLLQGFLSVIALSTLVLNASVAEQRAADLTLRHAYDDLEQRVAERNRELTAANRQMTREILDRQRAESALRESEARLKAAVDNVPFDFWICDRDSHYIYQNSVSLRLAGDILGKRPDDVAVPDAVRARWRENYERAFSGEVVRWDGVYDHRGSIEYRREALAPIQLDGETIGVVGMGMDVTAERVAQARLLESEERFRLLAEQSHDLICIHEPDGRYLYVSPSSERLLGYRPEELIGRDPYEFFHPMDHDRIRSEAHERNLRGERRTRVAYRFRRKGGEYTWLDTLTSVVRDDTGRVLRLQTFSRDISEQHRIEEALQTIAAGTASSATSDFFRTLVRHLADAVGARVALITELVEGGGPAAPQRVRSLALWLGHDFGDNIEYDVAGTACETVLTGEARFYPSGLSRLFTEPPPLSGLQLESYLGTPLLDAGRRPLGVLAVLHDAPMEASDAARATMSIFAARAAAELERARAERELSEREELYRLLFESELNAVLLLDLGTRTIVEANDAFFRLYGYSRDELPSLTPAVMSAEPEKTMEAIDRVAREGRVIVDERLHRKKDGTVFPVELYTRTLTWRGRPFSVGVIRDLTERRRAEEDRKRLEAQILQAQKLESLGVLAGGIAHDFNNLLVGILGNAGLALLELAPDSPARESIQEIEAASVRAADLTRQMLAYAGKGRFVLERIDVSLLVREMVKLLRSVISKKASLSLQLADKLPTVEADATQIRQIVMNLITNASDAIGDREGTISVSTGVMHADRGYLASAYLHEELPVGDYVWLEVADTGIGMDADMQTRIFDPFFSTKFTGRGLGLAAVLGIVRGHGGTIHVRSETARGSAFRVLLPFEATGAGAAPEVAPAEAGAVDWRGHGTVLLVDDEPGVLRAASRMLEHGGLSVLTAADGREAVDLFARRSDLIDVVVLDLTMPRMGGEEALRELRKLRADVRVVLSSGFSEEEVEERFAGAGVVGFVQKPYRPSSLLAMVRHALEPK